MMDLPSLLHTQDDYLSQMQGILEEEFSLLEQHQALALPALTERKQQLLAAIETLDKTLAEMPETGTAAGSLSRRDGTASCKTGCLPGTK